MQQESYVETEAEEQEEAYLLSTLNAHRWASPCTYRLIMSPTLWHAALCVTLCVNAFRDELQQAGNSKDAQGWLRGSLQTATGTRQLYNALQQYVQKPAFLDKITAARNVNAATYSSLRDTLITEEDVASVPSSSHAWPSSASQDADFVPIEVGTATDYTGPPWCNIVSLLM